ncbi:DNA-directed RNA polymerase II subunit rpb1 [Elsinoe australis]|uniref:DNA-directed RNA polymerase II subunit rpb1 n=1 Tax=Elsinoe australis TaxID=40998 RepID=A0A2P7YW42_9PEZI|nr:DNA-directed RNA polymerase II subunit rpb1 [Elsinoe australis]
MRREEIDRQMAQQLQQELDEGSDRSPRHSSRHSSVMESVEEGDELLSDLVDEVFDSTIMNRVKSKGKVIDPARKDSGVSEVPQTAIDSGVDQHETGSTAGLRYSREKTDEEYAKAHHERERKRRNHPSYQRKELERDALKSDNDPPLYQRALWGSPGGGHPVTSHEPLLPSAADDSRGGSDYPLLDFRDEEDEGISLPAPASCSEPSAARRQIRESTPAPEPASPRSPPSSPPLDDQAPLSTEPWTIPSSPPLFPPEIDRRRGISEAPLWGELPDNSVMATRPPLTPRLSPAHLPSFSSSSLSELEQDQDLFSPLQPPATPRLESAEFLTLPPRCSSRPPEPGSGTLPPPKPWEKGGTAIVRSNASTFDPSNTANLSSAHQPHAVSPLANVPISNWLCPFTQKRTADFLEHDFWRDKRDRRIRSPFSFANHKKKWKAQQRASPLTQISSPDDSSPLAPTRSQALIPAQNKNKKKLNKTHRKVTLPPQPKNRALLHMIATAITITKVPLADVPSSANHAHEPDQTRPFWSNTPQTQAAQAAHDASLPKDIKDLEIVDVRFADDGRRVLYRFTAGVPRWRAYPFCAREAGAWDEMLLAFEEWEEKANLRGWVDFPVVVRKKGLYGDLGVGGTKGEGRTGEGKQHGEEREW